MKKGYTVFVSEEAKREHESRPAPRRRKKDCPACEIKAVSVDVNETVKNEKPAMEGEE